jgi:hypothetical protein
MQLFRCNPSSNLMSSGSRLDCYQPTAALKVKPSLILLAQGERKG